LSRALPCLACAVKHETAFLQMSSRRSSRTRSKQPQPSSFSPSLLFGRPRGGSETALRGKLDAQHKCTIQPGWFVY
jgi:hypothetical protein